jgi:hypothetical protein
MKGHELWRMIEEAKVRGQNEATIEDNGANITIHVDNTDWYPDYY